MCACCATGKSSSILAEELVPGDVMLLAEGDHISADARLVEETELRVDQSTLTGESHPVRKTSEAVIQEDLTLQNCRIWSLPEPASPPAPGRAVVFATGMDTEFGKIARLTQTVGEELSPLQKEMERVTRLVTIWRSPSARSSSSWPCCLAGVSLAESFIFAMGMIVAFVPEGLLPTVTLALAMGVQRMARRHALVKRLSAVETLGCTTVICTDKTGTLTQNEMTVTQHLAAGPRLAVTGVGYAPQGQIDWTAQPARHCLTATALGAGLRNCWWRPACATMPACCLPTASTALDSARRPDRGGPARCRAKGGVDLEAEARLRRACASCPSNPGASA